MNDYTHLAVRSSFDPISKQLDYDKLAEMGFLRIEDTKLYEQIFRIPKPPRPFPMKQMEKNCDLGCMSYHMACTFMLFCLNEMTNLSFYKCLFEKELFPQILFPLLTFAFVIVLYIGIIKKYLAP